MTQSRRTIALDVPMISRLEGEGALTLRASQGRLESVHLKIYEPPRFFEKFLEGKHFSEQPHLAARICGICPIAYQLTGIRAIEQAMGVTPSPWVQDMRRVVQCGEWLQSHSLHIHFLAAPDYLGFEHVLALADKFPDEVGRAMRLQGLGNALLNLFGARSVHPIGLTVGGFFQAPSPEAVAALQPKLDEGLADAEALVRWCASLPLPEDHQPFVSVALQHATDYPMNEGQVVSSQGLQIPASDYRQHFIEHQEPHSTALYSLHQGQPYLVGPLARMNLNHARLPEPIQHLARELGLRFPSDNLYHSLLARALECYLAVWEAHRLLDHYHPQTPRCTVTPRAGWGAHCTEAPRGLIYHHYRLDEEGHLIRVCIIPPTSQNQARIEADLRDAVPRFGLEHDDATLQRFCERLVRNYDPCISCSVHFLRLKVERH